MGSQQRAHKPLGDATTGLPCNQKCHALGKRARHRVRITPGQLARLQLGHWLAKI